MKTLPELSGLLSSRFAIERTPRALGKALGELGLRPTNVWRDRHSRQGRVGYYDPLVCWALLVDERTVVPRQVLHARVEKALTRASEAVWKDFGGTPDGAPTEVQNEWQWRVQATAVHLFVSDPRHGLSALELVALRHAKLHQYTLDSPACLRATLAIYAAELKSLLAARTHDAAARLLSDEALFERESRVLDSLDSFGVLRASSRRLGPAPCATRAT